MTDKTPPEMAEPGPRVVIAPPGAIPVDATTGLPANFSTGQMGDPADIPMPDVLYFAHIDLPGDEAETHPDGG
jgi:hypothetical protein